MQMIFLIWGPSAYHTLTQTILTNLISYQECGEGKRRQSPSYIIREFGIGEVLKGDFSEDFTICEIIINLEVFSLSDFYMPEIFYR